MTVTREGKTLTCASNYTIGSLTLNSVSQGSHTLSISYTPPATGGGVVGGGGGCVGACASPTPAPSVTPTPRPTPSPTPTTAPSGEVQSRTIDSSTSVTGTFGKTSTTFELTYKAGANGFYGDITFTLPFAYADYTSGVFVLTPSATRARQATISGAWAATAATWEKVSLKPGEVFKITISVNKALSSGVLSLFSKPTLFNRARTGATSAEEPSEQPIATEGQVTAAGTDYSFVGALVLLVFALIAYFAFFNKPKTPRGL